MMLTKTILKEQLKSFPEEFSIDELVSRMILIEKINRADKQSERGEVIAEEELDKAMKKWFQ